MAYAGRRQINNTFSYAILLGISGGTIYAYWYMYKMRQAGELLPSMHIAALDLM
jgi:hypothetical protein